MIWSLQALRFVAALMIVYLHASQTAIEATGTPGFLPIELQIAGRAGVDIFFVLSGVIITKTAHGLTWPSFAWKRFRRIIPIYFIVCIPITIAAAFSGFGWRDLVATFLLWPATDVMTAPLLPVAWTLCFEALFYTAAALVLADRRFLVAILAIFVGSMAMRSHGAIFQFLGNPIILEFAMGVGLAFLPNWRNAVWLVPAGAIAILAAAFSDVAPKGDTLDFLTGEDGFLRVAVFGIPSAFIVYGIMQIKSGRNVWTYLGDGSYTLYLTHTIPITALIPFWAAYPIRPELIVLVDVAIAVLLAWRLFERVERPVLGALGRRWPSRPENGQN